MERKCLIADDVRASRMLMSSLLTGIGFDTVEVADGLEAWSELCEKPPHLVVTDIEMPVLSGLQLLRKIRRHRDKRISGVPVIVISSLQDALLEKTAIGFGANAVLNKPLNKELFQHQVHTVMRPANLDEATIDLNPPAGPISPTLRRLAEQARRTVRDETDG